jgi:threonine/homoserine/homoserine lactone efflux protein
MTTLSILPTFSSDLGLFFLLVLGVIVLPGMDMACVASHALVGGLRSGATAVAGIMAGGLVHVAVAMTGIAALLALWPAAFDALLVAGAIYMVWMGWTLLRLAPAPDASGSDAPRPVSPSVSVAPARVFRRALLTCLANPKAYAFSLAVFPAFVHSGARPMAMQFACLAGIVLATQAGVYGAVAMLAAGTGRLATAGAATGAAVAATPGGTVHEWMPRIVGLLLVGGAAVTLAMGWRPAMARPAAPSTAQASTAAPSTSGGGDDGGASADPARDFDFLMGDWHIENRKRLGILRNDDRWETFEADSHVRPLPAGTGNRDDYVAPAWRPGYVGVTIRVYSPQTRQWSLYWMTNTGAGLDPKTGELLPPVVGGFHGREGIFEGDDTWEGRPIRVRYTWRHVDDTHAQWEQAFSPDGGRTWETNWTMALTRQDPAAAVIALEHAIAEASIHGDLATLDRHLAEGFTLVNGRGEIGDKRENLEELRSGTVRYTRFENRDMQARVIDHDTAIVNGFVRVAGTVRGEAFDKDLRFTDTFVREAGGWRMVAAQVSPVVVAGR